MLQHLWITGEPPDVHNASRSRGATKHSKFSVPTQVLQELVHPCALCGSCWRQRQPSAKQHPQPCKTRCDIWS
jgi:hypothetical protein